MTLHQVSRVVIPREKWVKMGVQASCIVSMVTMRVKGVCYSWGVREALVLYFGLL